MPRNVFQTLTVVALVAATVFVAHNFVRYLLRVNGGYSEWTVFTECTKTCGTGTRFRTRTCNNPSPRFGGFDCNVLGEDTQTFKCNILPCPVDGGYGAWSDFGECSVTCGEGVQQRERKCDNPEPMFGGKSCDELELGPSVETKACVLESCPVHGGYSQWSEFGECSVTCGEGVQQRDRRCDSPEPQFGGKTCEELGSDKETQACNKDPCPIDGGYSEWSAFSDCTVTCGGGAHERTRECTNPKAANGGRTCEGLGPDKETEECNTQACPVQDQGKEEVKDTKSKNDETKQGNEKESEEKQEEKKEEEEEKEETEKKEESKEQVEKKEEGKKEESKVKDEKKQE